MVNDLLKNSLNNIKINSMYIIKVVIRIKKSPSNYYTPSLIKKLCFIYIVHDI